MRCYLSVLALLAVLVLPQFADAGLFRNRRGGVCSGGGAAMSACAPQFSGGCASGAGQRRGLFRR